MQNFNRIGPAVQQLRTVHCFFARKQHKMTIKIRYRGIVASYGAENLHQRREISYESACKISCRSAKRFESYCPPIIEIRFFAAKIKWTVYL